MCETKNQLILCSCLGKSKSEKNGLNQNSNSDEEKSNYFTWHLYQYVGVDTRGRIGKMLLPVKTIGTQMSNEYVLGELNSRNCFDFEYTPTEGDYLKIRKDNESDYLAFAFTNGVWIAKYYDAFTKKLGLINKGIIDF